MKSKITLLLMLLSLVFPAFSDTNAELQHFMQNLGFDGNVSSPHSFNTQSAGYVTLGSAYERNQVRNLQLMHVDVPGIRSGCGGIDMFYGAFSFISKDQITKFMQNILSSGAGYAFNLALETELPEVAHALQYMQTIADKINSQNYNSCEMGEDLVGGLWPKNRAANQQICQDIGTHDGVFSDWAKARQECAVGGQADKVLDQGKKEPEYKERILKSTNVVWDAIQKNSFLASDEKLSELYMSISGTLVFDEKGAPQTYPSLLVNRDFIRSLLYGGTLPSYICHDPGKEGKCLSIDASSGGTQEISPQNGLVSQVEVLLTSIYDKIIANTPLSSQEIKLIEMTHQSPVFSMIVANAETRTGVQGIHLLAQAMASDLLSQFLTEAVTVIRGSLAGKSLGGDNEATIYRSIENARKIIEAFQRQSRADFNQVMQVNINVQKLQAQSVHQLSGLLQQGYEDVK